ncbi:Uncharacterized protein dnm_042990 [Desulfonema magnum]|uniref:Uncharacterized protein n=1 Tax=Desulfonema magnum TaxID=45655 RepID=A0A975GNY6_9BACT|nr:Uncharacterized protein dnm_042990 [Desulfonema magnum]
MISEEHGERKKEKVIQIRQGKGQQGDCSCLSCVCLTICYFSK